MSGIEDVRLELSTGTCRLRVVGSGRRALVLFPAVMDSAEAFGRLQWLLRKALPPGFASVAVDPPGYHGATQAPRFDTWTRFAAELVEALEARFPEALVFAGNSSGAVAATEAALQSRVAAGLCWICWCDWRGAEPHGSDVLCPADEAALDRLLDLAWHAPPRLDTAARAAMQASARRNREHVASFDADGHRQRLAQYGGPLLIVSGTSDGLVPVQLAARTAAAFPGAEHAIIDACGHYPHREQPRALATLLSDFVGRSAPTTSFEPEEPGGHNAAQSDR